MLSFTAIHWQDITWLQPWALLLLPLPIVFYVLLPAAKPQQGRALIVPDLDRFSAFASQKAAPRGRRLAIVLLGLVWLFLLTALARPQVIGDAIGIPVSGRDLMLGIDISGSMRETDLYANNRRATRMAVVKKVASEFVARRTGDRVGVIMFGSQAYVQTPLTYDHATVQHFLDEAAIGLAGHSTAIGDAIGLGIKRLRDRPESTRVFVLLTDGENSAGVVNPIEAARLAAKNKIRIHTIGVGSDPRGTDTFALGLSVRRSQVDEPTLRQIADLTGGRFFRAKSTRELEAIYREIDKLEPTENDENTFRPRRELFHWPLAIALVCSVLWGLYRWRANRGHR